jgi:NAD(P)-dependent dehydrogenase (short-subunit alcohol dehydrogenase family)
MYGMELKHVVVTGGTGALGTAVVGACLEAGAICHVPGHRPAKINDYPHLEHPRMHVTANIDLTDEASVGAFYDALPGLFASIHLAGGFAMSPLANSSKEDLLRMLDVNLTTCFLCCRHASRRIDASASADGGRIVNVSAKAGIEPMGGAGMAAYAASKAAVSALTQALSQELVAGGILVNAVAPSILDTPSNRSAMPNADHARWPKVDAVARTILFLASPHNTVTRGAVVQVYGRS